MSVSTDCCCVVITIIEWTRIMWSGLNGQCYEQFRVDSLLRKVMKKDSTQKETLTPLSVVAAPKNTSARGQSDSDVTRSRETD